jgi:hypothetical protein
MDGWLVGWQSDNYYRTLWLICNRPGHAKAPLQSALCLTRFSFPFFFPFPMRTSIKASQALPVTKNSRSHRDILEEERVTKSFLHVSCV